MSRKVSAILARLTDYVASVDDTGEGLRLIDELEAAMRKAKK